MALKISNKIHSQSIESFAPKSEEYSLESLIESFSFTKDFDKSYKSFSYLKNFSSSLSKKIKSYEYIDSKKISLEFNSALLYTIELLTKNHKIKKLIFNLNEDLKTESDTELNPDSITCFLHFIIKCNDVKIDKLTSSPEGFIHLEKDKDNRTMILAFLPNLELSALVFDNDKDVVVLKYDGSLIDFIDANLNLIKEFYE
ncbi:MAG: hypothetical protein SFU98_11790 [Leptospiraceae bacterium]|nr:hypothetical protein [Leptospiraceae bacterium]